jgi:hypothetical protein
MHSAPAGEEAGYVIRAFKITGLVPLERGSISDTVCVKLWKR